MPHFVSSVAFASGSGPSKSDAPDCVTPEVHFHGFLTNAAAVRRVTPPREVHPNGDAGIVLTAYRKWGVNLQRHLLGEYCLAIVDRRVPRVLLTHDGLGLRPIFYAVKGRTLHFGSKVGEVARAAKATDLDDYFVLGYLDGNGHSSGRTIYRDVKRLGAGQTVVWDGRALELRHSWDLFEVEPLRYRDPEEYEEHFRTLLANALRARAGARAWAELSGGLDSSSIVSTVAHERLAELDTVSFIFSRSATADERRWIQPVVARYDLPWHPVDVDGVPPFSVLPDRPVGQPTRAIAMWGQFTGLERAISVGATGTVLLSGFGGDQVLGGDMRSPIHLADLLRFGSLGRLLRELRAWQHADPGRRPLLYYALQAVAKPWWRNRRGLALEHPNRTDSAPWIEPWFAARVGPEVEPLHAAGRHESIGRRYFRDRILQIADAMPETWNHLTDSFDIRYPLLDRPLVEFMFAIPWDEKLQPGQDRALQRRALASVLPAETLRRTDKVGPDEAILRGYAEASDVRERLGRSPIVVERGFVNGDVWRTTVEAARVGKVTSLHSFVSSACLELWLQTEAAT